MSLKERAIKGMCWAASERFVTQAVGLCITIVLSRLLSPNDFGIVGIAGAFVAITQLFVDSGLTSALIRRQKYSEVDYSTVFWFNIIAAFICYFLLFQLAPFISAFYNRPELLMIIRVLGITLISNALFSVHVAKLTFQINFRLSAYIAVASCVLAGCVGIFLAYSGYGVLALIIQTLTWSMSSCLMYWLFSHWRPQFLFSYRKLKELYWFGVWVLLAECVKTMFKHSTQLIIGKKYNVMEVGLYNRGETLAEFPANVFQSVVGRVTYPLLASLQNSPFKLMKVYRKYQLFALGLMIPSVVVLQLSAGFIVQTIVGSQWIGCVPYLQILAVVAIFSPLSILAYNLLYVKGRSDLVVKLETVKKTFAFILILFVVQYGMLQLCFVLAGYSFFSAAVDVIVGERVQWRGQNV